MYVDVVMELLVEFGVIWTVADYIWGKGSNPNGIDEMLDTAGIKINTYIIITNKNINLYSQSFCFLLAIPIPLPTKSPINLFIYLEPVYLF